jgi:hypothetical protein
MMWKWFEAFVFHYEFARHLRQNIEGLTWRKAWSYHVPKESHDDPIEAAQAELSKMRRRLDTGGTR